MNKIQYRGHCQVCGNLQAVNGVMSKHGYKVNNGWFTGICSGRSYAPIEVDCSATKQTIEAIEADIVEMGKQIEAVESGKTVPAEIETNRIHYVNGKRACIMKSWSDASELDKREWKEKTAWKLRRRIRIGQDHIDYMTSLIERQHGKPLIEIQK